ncbi:MAG: endonuclease/exonuclease/phosphatase family protein [Gallionella sp.]|nr:endonuclease/exonuclease/phosphatase family protein [Gallionella sp.]
MLNIATYNIHKGFSQFNRRMVLHELRERLRELDADIVFLQEVQGEHAHHAQRHPTYPPTSQHEFIADTVWDHHAYGKNAVYQAGHHGNAILSRWPILQSHNLDMSAHRFEERGMLHSQIELKDGETVHCLCTHFGLFAKGRRQQAERLIAYVREQIPPHAPLIIAGDFNDWRNQLGALLAEAIAVHDVFQQHQGIPARSFPAGLPVLRLDRIYVRGFDILQREVHSGAAWRHISDHAALSAQLKRL